VGDGVFGEEVGGMVAVVVAGGEEVAEFAVGGEGCVSWAGDVGNLGWYDVVIVVCGGPIGSVAR